MCIQSNENILNLIKLNNFCLVRYHCDNDHGGPSWCWHLWCGTERKITKNFNATCWKCMESQESPGYHRFFPERGNKNY